jgi:hypothetical protein
MPFEIKYDEKQQCIFATFTGKITMELTREYIAALLPILEETGCQRLLSDSREAELNLSSRDILQFPKLAEASPLTARCKRAVLPPLATSGFEMYETLSTMQGQKVRVFTDRDEALHWLLDESV